MSLLSICQNVARDIKIEVPSTIIGNQGEEAQMLLVCAQKAGEALARRPQGGWVNMIREYDFYTVALGPMDGVITNTGPNGAAQLTVASTAGIVAGNFFPTGTGIQFNTGVASVDSATRVTLTMPASQEGAYSGYIFGQANYTLPSDFQRAIDNTMWDRTRYWQMRGPLSPQQWQFYKSSIYSIATVQRRFRFRRVGYGPGATTEFSIDPTPTDNGTPLVFEYVSNAWCQSSTGAPQTQWMADSDTGILDEYLIALSTEYRALDRLGMAYAEELNEYEREVSKAVATDGGSANLSIAPMPAPFLIGPWSVQDGNFPGG